jgi:RNA polymerase sigma-B factor
MPTGDGTEQDDSRSSAAAEPEIVNELVLAHLGLAEAIAHRYSHGRHDGGDLEQVAYLGLVKAARHFDRRKCEDFVLYAVPTISGEIKRYFRDLGWFIRPPRPVQELRSRLASESNQLAQELGHQPTPAELSSSLGEDLRLVNEALRAHESLRPSSLDAPCSPGDDSPILGDTIADTNGGMERAETMAALAIACHRLNIRDRRILYLRFFQDKTQREIGEVLGVTQMQISRLLTRILGELRTQLSADEDPDEEAVGDVS